METRTKASRPHTHRTKITRGKLSAARVDRQGEAMTPVNILCGHLKSKRGVLCPSVRVVLVLRVVVVALLLLVGISVVPSEGEAVVMVSVYTILKVAALTSASSTVAFSGRQNAVEIGIFR